MEQPNYDATALLKTLLERFDSLERDVKTLKDKQARRNLSAGASGAETPTSTADGDMAADAPEGCKATSDKTRGVRRSEPREIPPRQCHETPSVEGYESVSTHHRRKGSADVHGTLGEKRNGNLRLFEKPPPAGGAPTDIKEGAEPRPSNSGRGHTRWAKASTRHRKGLKSSSCKSPSYPDNTNDSCGCKTTNTARLPAARGKAKGSPGHLEGDHRRQVGGYHNKGSQDRLPVRTSPESETSHSTILCGTEPVDSGGDKGTSGQRSHNRSAQPSGRVLLKPVPCPQKARWTTPSNKPEGSEQFGSHRAFQDGGNTYPQRPCQSGGLDGKGGSKGCVFHNPNPPVSPQIPEVQVPTQMLSIPVPTIWPVIGSLGLYQDPEANPSSPPGDGGAIDSIHSQYSAPGGVPAASKEPCRGIGVPLAVPWVQGKLEKISIKPSPSDGIPGLYSRHSPNGVETPSGQNKKDLCRVTGHERGVSPRKSTGSAGGQDECNISGDPTSPSMLSAPTVGPVGHTQSTLSVLRGYGSPDNGVQGGTDVVGHPHDKLEWKVPPQEGSGHDNRFRCLTDRLGSNQSGPQDHRTTVRGHRQSAGCTSTVWSC